MDYYNYYTYTGVEIDNVTCPMHVLQVFVYENVSQSQLGVCRAIAMQLHVACMLGRTTYVYR